MTASLLETAIQIAAEAHAGQKQKNGQPYILHPLRVMARVSTEEEQIVAVLHDVLEDNPAASVTQNTSHTRGRPAPSPNPCANYESFRGWTPYPLALA